MKHHVVYKLFSVELYVQGKGLSIPEIEITSSPSSGESPQTVSKNNTF